jgi:hypothetical protein
LKKLFHKKGLVEWFKVKVLSSNPRTAKKKKKRKSTTLGSGIWGWATHPVGL